MIIIAEVSELTRKIKLPTDRVLSVNGDYQVDGIAFKLPATYEGDFDFSTAAARVHWTGVDKVEHTNLITEVDGNGYPLWVMPSELTQGGHGVIEFAISFVATDATAAVTKRWISDPVSFRNRRTVSGSNEDEEAEEEKIYERLASAIAAVRAAQASVDDVAEVLSSLGTLTFHFVDAKADMTDQTKLYVLTTDGYLYYYSTAASDFVPAFEVGGSQEVIDARMDENGTTYANLKTRINTGFTQLKEDLSQKASAIISTSDDVEVVAFNDGADNMPMKSLVLKLVPHQEGSGDPSPSNVREITGYTNVAVHHNTSQSATGAIAYHITFPSSAGTVYGGELDVVKGTLKVTHKKVDMASLNWSYVSATAIFYASLSDAIASTPTGDTSAVCSMYTRGDYPSAWEDGVFAVCDVNLSGSKRVWVKDGRYTDVTDFKTAVADQTLVYKLNTPLTFTLTPIEITTLLGSNAIWMDADGTIQCEYPADTKLYIDALTAPDGDMVADSNIASGKYFTVNNRLYLSTTAIAQGEAIVVGTNCNQTDLATALNAINA